MADGHLRLGLSLSGGGFRATLFHLGVVRFLRDADLLKNVTHICSVSGGSILAAHLVQHWEKYTSDAPSSPDERDQFDEAADQLVRFTQLNVRGRILRRVILRILRGNKPTWVTEKLEQYYADHLYDGQTLGELAGETAAGKAPPYPHRPYLHILATDVHNHALCSFTNDGFSVDFKSRREDLLPELQKTNLIPAALAVTASSAFPAMFPPIEVTKETLHLPHLPAGSRLLTDGGVYDNLGLRKFRQLSDLNLGSSYLRREDIKDFILFKGRLLDASDEASLAKHIFERLPGSLQGRLATMEFQDDNESHQLVDSLNLILKDRDFYKPQSQPDIKGLTEEAKSLARGHRDDLHPHQVVRLNRLVFEAAFPSLIQTSDGGFTTIFSSDASQPVDLRTPKRPIWQGLLARIPLANLVVLLNFLMGTALRAADILHSRISALEHERAKDHDKISKLKSEENQGEGRRIPRFTFAKITDTVEQNDDRTAPDTTLQQQLPYIRTDLDRFSPTEISALVRHGYCVARQAVKQTFGIAVDGPPWVPQTLHQPKRGVAAVRELAGQSCPRRWRLVSTKDPLVIVQALVLVVLIGVTLYWVMERDDITELFHSNEENVVTVQELSDVDGERFVSNSGFEVFSDSRMVDLRYWRPVHPDGEQWYHPKTWFVWVFSVARKAYGTKRISPVKWTRQLQLQRTNEKVTWYKLYYRTGGAGISLYCVECESKDQEVKIEKRELTGSGETEYLMEVDVSKYPVNRRFLLTVDAIYWNAFQRPKDWWAEMKLDNAGPELAIFWVEFPRERPVSNVEGWSWEKNEEERTKAPDKQLHIDKKKQLVRWTPEPEANHTYRVEWKWEGAQW